MNATLRLRGKNIDETQKIEFPAKCLEMPVMQTCACKFYCRMDDPIEATPGLVTLIVRTPGRREDRWTCPKCGYTATLRIDDEP